MKTLLTSLLIFSCTLTFAQKKVKFDKVKPLPNAGFSFAYTQTENDVYVIGGVQGYQRFSSIIHVYESKRDTWLSGELAELPDILAPSATYMEDYKGIIIAGGTRLNGSNEMLEDTIRMLDVETFNVKPLGRLPQSAKRMGIAHSENQVFFFGGSTKQSRLSINNFTFSDKLFSYNLDKGTIEALTSMPNAMETQGGVIDGNLYVFGGYDERPLADIYQYNIADKTWKTLRPLESGISAYALAQYEHYFILVGDYHDGDKLIVYNTQTQTARYFTTNFRGRHLGASVIGTDLHVYGGVMASPRASGGYMNPEHFKISVKQLIEGEEW
ncbi:kelch repeat-containing protein [Roseivirga pacifica]|uniref:kelch repeat-containing protein n=1 Tax=Roseivirga pacifica TaxID=1267423 RepID=UPI00227ADAA8|nr:kelch repeat-containing protein [Roseivirga pacifica]